MSYTELHYGKVQVYKDQITLEEFKQFLEENPNLKEDDNFFDIEERFESEYIITIRDVDKKYKKPMYMPYFIHRKTLYKMLEHSGELEADYVNMTKQNTDDTIDFTYLFYNGGTCLTEMLGEGLDKVNKNK